MKTVPAQLHTALVSGRVIPEPRIIAGATTIPAGKIVLYDVHEYGVLGGANLVMEIDNSDGAYTDLAGIRPRSVITTQEGARIAGTDYYVTRHVWNVIHCEPSSYADHPTTLRIEAKNNWELFAACSFQSAAWNVTAIGSIIDDIAAMAGVTLDRDESTFWSHLINWQLDAAFPYQPLIGALLGEQDNSQVHAYGRFEADGSWYLQGLSPNPAASANLNQTNTESAFSTPAVRLTTLGYHPASTRIVIHGLTTSIAGLLPELETILGGSTRARRITVNARHLRSAALVDRLKQEAIQQREIYRTGTIDISPDLRLQLWDVVALYGVAGVTNASTWRVTDIRTIRKPGKFVYSLTIRSTAAADTFTTDIPTDPVVIDNNTVRDNFDTYGSGVIGSSVSVALQWVPILRFEPTDGTTNEAGVVYDATYKVEGSYSAKIPVGKSVILPLDHVDLTAEGRFTSADFLCLSVYTVTPDTFIRIGFSGPDLDTSYDYPISSAGWTFIKLTRAQFDQNQDWSDVTQIVVQNVSVMGAAHDKWVDDLRIVKEDPASPTRYNDTGQSWDFSGDASDYEWHIYQDVAGIPYSLGQIHPRLGYRYQALRNGAYAADNHFATGVLFRDAGNALSGAGLVAFAVDATHRYRLILHATTPRLELFRDNGTLLASVSLPAISLNTKYYLGLERDGQYLNAYLSTDGTNLFSGPNLRIHVTDATYLAGRVGVEADGLNARFFQVRAGSPEHALTAEFAYYTDPHGHTHDYTEIENTAHTHAYAELQNIPATFPPDAHTHVYGTLQNIPATFTPAAHTHTGDTLSPAALNVNTTGAGAGQIKAAGQIITTVATGAPLSVASAAVVPNLNADKHDGYDAATSGANAHVVATDASGHATISGGINGGSATGAAAGELKLSGSVKQSTSIGARVYHNAAQTIQHNTTTTLTFNSERYDTDAIHDPGASTRLTCKTAGIYTICVNVVWVANGTGIRNIAIQLNGGTVIARDVRDTNAASNTVMELTTQYQLAVNDYVEVVAYQDSGSPVNITVVGNVSPEFSMVRSA